jgi:Exportin-5 family
VQLIRAIHALWSEPVAQNLNAEIKAAKSMSSVEQASLLGETAFKLHTGRSQIGSSSDGDVHAEAESKENDIRNWLKGTRDSGLVSNSQLDPLILASGHIGVFFSDRVCSISISHFCFLVVFFSSHHLNTGFLMVVSSGTT